MEACGFGTDIFEAIKQGGDAMSSSNFYHRRNDWYAKSLPYGIDVGEFQKGRVVALFKGGLLGCLPSETSVGDVVGFLFGGWVPFALRPLGGDQNEPVGHCYVHGIVDGEWMEAGLASMTNADWLSFNKTFETFIVR